MRLKLQSGDASAASLSIFPSDLSEADFREGLSRLGAAVNIITTDGPAGRAGFTASAVCSVTDSPPTLVVPVDRSSSHYKAFVSNNVLCVNTLRPVHEQLSRLFGGNTPEGHRFAAATWKRRASGAPMLEGAAVAFDCRIVRISDIGNHSVLFCQVISIDRHEMTSGLIRFDRGHHRIYGIRRMAQHDRVLNWTPLATDNRRWDSADIERLRELAAADIPKIDIASALDRTSIAVEVQARKHGIKLKRPKRSHYSEKSGSGAD